MNELGPVDYAAVFAVTASLALVLTPVALRLALRHAVLDRPSPIKAQESPVPYFGGLAIVASFSVVIVVAASVRSDAADEVALIIGLALLLAVLGLVDDVRGLGPAVRIAVELGAAVTIAVTSEGVAVVGNTVIDTVITVVWIVGVTNSLNLLDNMDGLSAGTAAIAAGWIFVIAAVNGQFLVATLAIALAGCSAGFLRSNFHPARIYMGDAGAYFLGFMLAVLAIRLRFDAPTDVTFLVPILVLGVPLFDTSLVVVNRVMHRLSPVSGGRDHTSHRLVFIGIPVRASVLLIYAGGASMGWLGLVASNLDRGSAYLLAGWVFTVAVFLGVLLSLVPVYETSRRRHLMLQEVRRHEVEPPAAIGRSELDETA